MSERLKGKRMLVTQASAYMGSVTAQVLAEVGALKHWRTTAISRARTQRRCTCPSPIPPSAAHASAGPACGRSAVRPLRLRHVQPDAGQHAAGVALGPAPTH